MRVKLDENLGTRGAAILRQPGHDVVTVREQDMCSAPDRLLERGTGESRCLVIAQTPDGPESLSL